MQPLRVGLVGAGPWAHLALAPALAAHPGVAFAGIWARRAEAAEELAQQWGSEAVPDLDDLLERCEAVAFCVPPDVQCALATRAALAGKHLLLDKPVGLDSAQVQGLVSATERSGVLSQVLLTNRYDVRTRELVARARAMSLHGLQLTWVNAAVTGDQPFATPWRLAEGVLLDLGPHAIDLAHACAGPVVDVQAVTGAHGWAAVTLTHASGSVSQLSLSFSTAADRPVFRLELFDAGTCLTYEPDPAGAGAAISTALSEFVQAVRTGTRSELDVRHGLALQQLLDRAVASAQTRV